LDIITKEINEQEKRGGTPQTAGKRVGLGRINGGKQKKCSKDEGDMKFWCTSCLKA